jgi:hypothetical protein
MDCPCRLDRCLDHLHTRSSGVRQIVHASLVSFKIRPMLGLMFMAAGKKIRADAGRDR